MRNLLFLSPHLMACLGGTVTGTVDTSYDVNDLVDGDPSWPISRDGALSLAVTGVSVAGCNGAVVANTNLLGAVSANFTGDLTATVVTPAVPPGLIRKNGYITFSPVTVDSFTLAIASQPVRIIIGEVFVGKFQELRALPPESSLAVLPFEIPYEGEYGGLSQTKSAEARRYGGSVYVSDATKLLLDDWHSACMENSLPSVIIPIPSLNDAWVVKWITYSPLPSAVGSGLEAAWRIDVEWEELPRYRWP